MNRRRYGFLFFAVITAWTLTFAPIAFAQGGFAKVGTYTGTWERMMRDARAEALGGSLQALASGPFAMLENAAPLRGDDSIEVGYGRFGVINDELEFEQMALAGQWNGLRLGLLVANFDIEPFEVRTAYNPEGTGEYIDFDNDFVMANLAWDLPIPGLDRSRAWSWTAGATWRRHSVTWDESTWTAWDTDLGLTARWLRPRADGWVRVTGTALLRNPFKQDLEYDDRHVELPRYRNLGIALTWAQDLLRNGRNDLVIHVGLSTMRDYMVDEGFFGELRSGFEVELAGLVSLRAGSDERRAYASEQSWGAGLSLPRWVSDRFLLRYDYAHLSDNYDWEGRDRHSITAGLNF